MLCELANYFPPLAANFLERSNKLRRRFREESITDLLMANILAAGGGAVLVDFPDEPTTGADMEWTFVNTDTNQSFQLLLQAKKLHDAEQDWRRQQYRELFYKTGAGNTLQVDLLCNTATSRASAFPLYVFYNPSGSCSSARRAGATNIVGVNLCAATTIRSLAYPARFRSSNRTLGNLQPHLFRLSDVFCPNVVEPLGPLAFAGRSIPLLLTFSERGPILGRPFPPTPEVVRSRLTEILSKTLSGIEPEASTLALPPVSDSVPEDVQELVKNLGFIERRTPLNYWRVVFLSHNPRSD